MAGKVRVRWCAVCTRKSSEEGLEQDFNSLDAQREAGEAYIESQRHEGWRLVPSKYDDGGYSGGLRRPSRQRLLADIRAGKLHTVVVYKVDRLTRSVSDFAKLIEAADTDRITSFAAIATISALSLGALSSEEPDTDPPGGRVSVGDNTFETPAQVILRRDSDYSAIATKLAIRSQPSTDAGNVGPASIELRAAGEQRVNRSADQ